MILRYTGLRNDIERLHACSRQLHASCSRLSHVGSKPIDIPQNVTLDWPILSTRPDLTFTSPNAKRYLKVSGPFGSQTLFVPPPVILHPPAKQNEALTVTVHDPTQIAHRSFWGLTRSLIQNAIEGVTKGFSVQLHLVGVGYRATLEPIPQATLDLLAQRRQDIRPSRPGAPPYVAPARPVSRLNLRLGYANPILINIPADITVNVLSPTQIKLSGNDKQRLGLLAAQIRRWRKPEPYRGKVCLLFRLDYRLTSFQGVFVGEETIKLKEIKKK